MEKIWKFVLIGIIVPEQLLSNAGSVFSLIYGKWGLLWKLFEAITNVSWLCIERVCDN